MYIFMENDNIQKEDRKKEAEIKMEDYINLLEADVFQPESKFLYDAFIAVLLFCNFK